MEINEVKQKLEFYHDALYQAGFDLGWNAALESLEHIADALWNSGQSATGESLRDILNRVRKQDELV